jgi:hypothetical protein
MQAADFAERLAQIYCTESEPTRAQCNAVMAFSVRVASPAILNLSQVAFGAGWGFEYGITVFVWTWVLVLEQSLIWGCRQP